MTLAASAVQGGQASRDSRAPTLELRAASFRRGGGVVTAPVTVRSSARHVGLVGEWEPFFRGLTGECALASGSAQILGCELGLAIASGVVGYAPCDAPLPGSLSVREYLELAARLSHGSRARATAEASRALEEYELNELAAHQLGALVAHQRRALAVTVAALSGPPVLCIEAPLRGLDASAADYVARLCAHAAKRSLTLISAALPSTPSAERTLLDGCDELFFLHRGTLIAQGSPESVFGPSARFLLTLAGPNGDEVRASLTQAGCQLSEQPNTTAFAALLAPSSRVTRYLVELPSPGRSELLLDAALEHGATVLELEPLFDG